MTFRNRYKDGPQRQTCPPRSHRGPGLRTMTDDDDESDGILIDGGVWWVGVRLQLPSLSVVVPVLATLSTD
jgi:hypothetical protein